MATKYWGKREDRKGQLRRKKEMTSEEMTEPQQNFQQKWKSEIKGVKSVTCWEKNWSSKKIIINDDKNLYG